MSTKVFKTPHFQCREHNGIGISEIIKELDETETLPEVGRMYRIKLDNGVQIDAYEYEIIDA